MTQDDNQPMPACDQGSGRTTEEMSRVCGKAIAFVLAFDPDSNAPVKPAIEALRHTGVSGIYLLACPLRSEQIVEEVRTIHFKGNRLLIQPIECDPAALEGMPSSPDKLVPSDLPQGLLEIFRVLAESSLDAYESVLVVDASENRYSADGLFDLCCKVSADADTGTASYGDEESQRFPTALSRSYLEEASQSV